MEDLETVLPGGVQVTSIDPSATRRTGRITMQLRVDGARDRADDLVRAIGTLERFIAAPHYGEERSRASGGSQPPAWSR